MLAESKKIPTRSSESTHTQLAAAAVPTIISEKKEANRNDRNIFFMMITSLQISQLYAVRRFPQETPVAAVPKDDGRCGRR